MIPGLGRSAGEGIDYPLQYSWASLVAQLVKNSPAMRETWVRSLGWIPGLGKSPGEGKGSLQYSGLENSMDCLCIVRGVMKSRTWLSGFHFHLFCHSPHNPLCSGDHQYVLYICESVSVFLMVFFLVSCSA